LLLRCPRCRRRAAARATEPPEGGRCAAGRSRWRGPPDAGAACEATGQLTAPPSVRQNDLTFLRLRSKKHEIMVAPDKDYLLIIIQDPNNL